MLIATRRFIGSGAALAFVLSFPLGAAAQDVAGRCSVKFFSTTTLHDFEGEAPCALLAIDAGAEDFAVEEEGIAVYTKPEDLMAVRQALVDLGHEPDSAEIDRVPTTTVPLDASVAVQTLRMLERLEDLDDVQKVYSNADFPEEVLAGYDG